MDAKRYIFAFDAGEVSRLVGAIIVACAVLRADIDEETHPRIQAMKTVQLDRMLALAERFTSVTL